MSWPLPLYELALLAATDLRARGAKARLTLVTPEATPLALFGAEASSLVAQLLDDHGIEVVCEAEPLAAESGRLRLVDGRGLAHRVVTLPRPAGARQCARARSSAAATAAQVMMSRLPAYAGR